MKEYLAERLIQVWAQLFQCTTDSFRLKPSSPNGPRQRAEICKKLEFVEQQANILGLRSTAQGAVRLQQQMTLIKPDKIPAAIQSLNERFHDDIVGLVFLYLPTEKRSYHNRTDLFGETFKANFPAANSEVIEAGNCFSLGRNTACVFHLMRSLEVVLKALFAALGLPPLTSAGERNWNGILSKIKGHLDVNKKSLPDFDFYDGAYAFLAAAKNPIRNATMHVDATYDEDGARTVFDAVGAFMRHVATKLKDST